MSDNENEKRETLADIVAEMKRTKYGADDCSVRWCLREWADRIEAAWKRERDELVYAYDPTKAGNGRLPDGSAYALEAMREPEMGSHAVGNASAMREALEDVLEKIDRWRTDGVMEHWQYSQLFDIADAALSAPARNCDVFRSEAEAKSAFIAYYNETFDLKGSDAIDTCDLKHDVDGILHDYIQWLLAPAKPETKGEV